MYFTGFRLLGVMWDRYNRNELNRMLQELYGKNNSFQTQLDNLVISSGDSNAEVVQARGDNDLLYQRLDDIDLVGQFAIGGINNQASRIDNVIEAKLDKSVFANTISKTYVFSQDYNTLQEAFYAAEGKTLIVKAGHYDIATPIYVKSNTTVISNGATYLRTANINVMFINQSNGSKGGYEASENIRFISGTYDANKGTHSAKCTMIAFGHSNNIQLLGCTFKNLEDWHMVEYNSVRDGLIQFCTFDNYGTNTVGTEMVQIDIARGSAQFPWFGPYDNTTCDNVRILNNRFTNGVRGVGTHSSTSGFTHKRITVEDNYFENMSGEVIISLDWNDVVIKNNEITNSHVGIKAEIGSNSTSNYLISNNNIHNMNKITDKSRGIWIESNSSGNKITEGVVENNTINGIALHGLGIDYSDDWKVDGNTVNACSGNGIFIYGSSRVRVNGNSGKGSAYDISCTTGSEDVIISHNVADKIISLSTASRTLFIGNITKQLTSSGSSNVAVNNFVNGVFVP